MDTQRPPVSPPKMPHLLRPPPAGTGGTGRQNKGCFASLGCLLGLSILFNLILVLVVASTSKSGSSPSMVDEVAVSGRGKNKIAVIRMNGTIMGGRSRNNIVGARTFSSEIARARKDKSVRGVLLLVNSPGGSVSASDQMHHAMLKLKKSGKPSVVLMRSVCASGCVYATASASKLYAEPTTITGSIGVIMSALNFAGLMEKHGVKSVVIASKKNKALLSPFLPVQDEHKTILKSLVDDMYGRFTGIVSKYRKIPKDKLAAFADGRVFSATDAKKYGLIDGIGYIEKAKRSILKLTGLKKARFVKYKRRLGLSDFLRGYAQLPEHMKQAAKKPSLHDLMQQSSPKMYYLWNPPTK